MSEARVPVGSKIIITEPMDGERYKSGWIGTVTRHTVRDNPYVRFEAYPDAGESLLWDGEYEIYEAEPSYIGGIDAKIAELKAQLKALKKAKALLANL